LGNIVITAILTAVPAAILTSLVTYWLSSRKELKNRVRDNKLKLLDDVYAPIMQILNNCGSAVYGYEVPFQAATKIIKIVDENTNVVDNKLMDFRHGLRDEAEFIGNNGGHPYNFDGGSKLLEYVEYRSNLLKKEVNRPYDSSVLKSKKDKFR